MISLINVLYGYSQGWTKMPHRPNQDRFRIGKYLTFTCLTCPSPTLSVKNSRAPLEVQNGTQQLEDLNKIIDFEMGPNKIWIKWQTRSNLGTKRSSRRRKWGAKPQNRGAYLLTFKEGHTRDTHIHNTTLGFQCIWRVANRPGINCQRRSSFDKSCHVYRVTQCGISIQNTTKHTSTSNLS